MNETLLIFLSAGLVSNLILDHMLGVDPVIALSRKPETTLDLILLMLILLPITTACGWLLATCVLQPMRLEYLLLPAQVMLICLLVPAAGMILQRFRPQLFARLVLYFPLVMVNCTILGVTLLNLSAFHNLSASIAYGFGSAAGFGLVMALTSAIRDRIAAADVPIPFKGTAILFITLGLMAMAFMGFTGLSPVQ